MKSIRFVLTGAMKRKMFYLNNKLAVSDILEFFLNIS